MCRASMNSTLSLRSVFALPLVEEPERAGERDRVEEVRADGDHHIDGMGLEQLLANLHLRLPGIGGGVRHDEPGPPLAFSEL